MLELFSCASTGGRFDVCMPSFEQARFLSSIKSDPGSFNRMLEAVSCERSSCSRKEDCESIFGSIRSTCGFARVDSTCLRAISRSLVALLRQQLLMLSSSETHEALVQKCDWTRSLGQLLWKEGDLAAAVAALESAHSLSVVLRGEFNRVTISCMRDYGGALRAMNNMALAQSVITQVRLRAQRVVVKIVLRRLRFLQSLDLSREYLGPNDPETIISMALLADMHQQRGEYTQASELYSHCVAVSSKANGIHHASTLSHMSNHAIALQHLGQLDAAASLHSCCLEQRQRLLGFEHPDTITARSRLGLLYQAQQRCDLAVPLLQECLEQTQRKHGFVHFKTLHTMTILAGCCMDVQDFATAEPLLSRCVEVSAEIHGDAHESSLIARSKYAGLLKTLGRVNRDHAKLKVAERLFRECLEIRLGTCGAGHMKTLIAKSNLGLLLQDMESSEEAGALLSQCASEAASALGPGHAMTARFAKNLESFSKKQQKRGLKQQQSQAMQ